MVPRAVLMKTGLKPFNTARTVNTAHPKSTVFSAKPMSRFSKSAQSTVRRPYQSKTVLSNKNFTQTNNTAKAKAVNTARPKAVNTTRPHSAVVNVVRVNQANAVKASACWVWRPTKLDSASITLKKHNYIDARGRSNGCSRHMTGNIAYLSDFKEFDEGYVTFGGGAHGGRISSKGTLKTDSLDFKDVYFVNELNFNLFSVSQMCDKKNYVLFTDTECLVLSPNFKLPDESQILLKIPRKDNMYSFDMKNIVPKESLTCLVAKATSDESMLWHMGLGHINFKNINKLVKDNLVRGLPTKRFENDQTCVACLKGKKHRASCKSKVLNPITKPLFMLHMDLFGLTFNFIKEIENLVDKKAKIIRSDNETEFKNKVIDDFCKEKGIKREYSVARTPQQNDVAGRRNRTLIEAARTMFLENKAYWFLEYKPMIEGNGLKWLFDINSLTQSMNYVPVTAGTISNDSKGTSEEISQDCIVMTIWKDTSYFDSPTKDVENGKPKTADDAQKQVKDSPNNENTEQDKFEDDRSTKDVNDIG
ncbi:putative ribonuclease H-like domain-containing protein [Tanacetum coccineum]